MVSPVKYYAEAHALAEPLEVPRLRPRKSLSFAKTELQIKRRVPLWCTVTTGPGFARRILRDLGL